LITASIRRAFFLETYSPQSKSLISPANCVEKAEASQPLIWVIPDLP
jgi:hypothetical protein